KHEPRLLNIHDARLPVLVDLAYRHHVASGTCLPALTDLRLLFRWGDIPTLQNRDQIFDSVRFSLPFRRHLDEGIQCVLHPAGRRTVAWQVSSEAPIQEKHSERIK